MDKPFLDSVREYLSNPKSTLFPHEDYKIIMNYYLPIGAPQNSKIKIPNDIVNDGDTHNVIKGFMPLIYQLGEKFDFQKFSMKELVLLL